MSTPMSTEKFSGNTVDLIRPSRRSFLGILGTLAVAPAIVRASSLMPIKPYETFGPDGYLTAQMIADEMACQMSLSGSRPISTLLHIQGNTQSCVDLQFPSAKQYISLESFSERYLVPAANALSQRARTLCAPPGLPSGIEMAAISVKRGCGVRYVTDYDIHRDMFMHRFDVMHA